MKKKKSIEPKRKRSYFGCGGAKLMCDACGEPHGICDCGNDSYSDHDECFGTGIAFMDIEEKDLNPNQVATWKKERKEEGLD